MDAKIDVGGLASKISGLLEKKRECKEKGHPNASRRTTVLFRGRAKVYMFCGDCETSYTRGLSSKESRKFYETLNRPMF